MYDRITMTIAAPATTPGTGAISLIRVSGPDTFRIVDSIVDFKSGTAAEAKGYTIKFGQVLSGDGSVIDEVLVSIFRAPKSYTGEDMAEISCHASSYIVSQIMLRLIENGVAPAEPGEFTKRAFTSGKMDLAQAEAVADIIAASSKASLKVALNQLKGGFSNELKEMRSKLLDITSLLELELDFSEEDVEFADREKLANLTIEVRKHVQKLADSFRTGNAIKNGVPVAIAGPTNAGKSTLLNAILGDDRAIVSDIAGTTRDTIEETFTIGGILFRFIDTAGIRESDDTIERIGIERTKKKIEEADIVLGVVDGTDQSNMNTSVNQILSHADINTQSVFILVNKADIKPISENERIKVPEGVRVFDISAKNGIGLETVKEELVICQKERMSANDQTLVTNLRHYNALKNAAVSLERVSESLSLNIPSDLVAQDLREAIYHIGSIVGEISTDEVLGNIFSKFCIGK